MKKGSLFEAYTYVVCIFALACGVITLGILIYGCVRISAPRFTMPDRQLGYVLSNERFKEWHAYYYKDKKGVALPENENELTKMRERRLQDAIFLERREGYQDLVYGAIILMIAGVVFAIHWRLGRKQRNQIE